MTIIKIWGGILEQEKNIADKVWWHPNDACSLVDNNVQIWILSFGDQTLFYTQYEQ